MHQPSLISSETLITAAVLATLVALVPAQRQFDELGGGALPADTDHTNSVVLGDVDGDGDLDMLATSGLQIRLHLNDGTGVYTNATEIRMPVASETTNAMALGDVDRDGDLDLVLGNAGLSGERQNRLYLNDGTGSYTETFDFPLDNTTTLAVALGDLDGDGVLDMVFGNDGPNTYSVYIDSTAGYVDFGSFGIIIGGGITRDVALGDVDGDGDLDAVLGNWDPVGRLNRLFLNDGEAFFTDATFEQLPLPLIADSTNAVALGDVDGDGDLDMVSGNGSGSGQQNRLYLNDGTGSFTDATSELMPSDSDITTSLALGDIDEDGDLDLVIGNEQQNRLYINDGTGNYSDATAMLMPVDSDVSVALAIGDVDGDGDIDMVFGNDGQNRLAFNLLRQLDAPLVLTPGSEYRLDAYSRSGPTRPGDMAVAYISTARANTAAPPFGTIGIDLSTAVGLPSFFIPQPRGMSSVSLTIPSQPRLIGVPVYAQALLLPFGNPWRLTNVTADVIVR